MLGVEYIIASLIIAKWFSILREPDQLFSWYNRMLIGWDEDVILNFNQESKFVFLKSFYYFDFRPFMYKVLTCSLCHSGYLAIYFIFAKDQHPIILPATMVVYYILSKVKFQ